MIYTAVGHIQYTVEINSSTKIVLHGSSHRDYINDYSKKTPALCFTFFKSSKTHFEVTAPGDVTCAID